MLSKEQNKERMRKARGAQKGAQPIGAQDKGAQTEDGTFFKDGIEYVPAAYVEGLEGRTYQSLPERPRYQTLSDGQVLDRTWSLSAKEQTILEMKAIRAANEACYNYHPNKGVISQELLSRMK